MCYLCSASETNLIEETLAQVKEALTDKTSDAAARNAKAQEHLATFMAKSIDIGRQIERNIKTKAGYADNPLTDNPR